MKPIYHAAPPGASAFRRETHRARFVPSRVQTQVIPILLASAFLSVPALAQTGEVPEPPQQRSALDQELSEVERALAHDGVTRSPMGEEVPCCAVLTQPELDLETQRELQLEQEWLEEYDGLRPGARIVGGFALGAIGLLSIVGSTILLRDDYVGTEPYAALAIVSGVIALAGLRLVISGRKQAERRRELRGLLRPRGRLAYAPGRGLVF